VAKKARWSINPRDIVSRNRKTEEGTLEIELPLLESGEKQATVQLTITADRALLVVVKGEPGMTLTDFQAWSDF